MKKQIEKIIAEIEALEETKSSEALQSAVISLREELKKSQRSRRSMEIRTKLNQRNLDVLNEALKGHTYGDIAKKLDLSIWQVSESVKVLHDQGLLPYRRKSKAVILEDCIDEVQKMMKTSPNKSAIAKELGVSEQTVVRCIQRISSFQK